MSAQPLTLLRGRTYRSKRPANAGGLVNDRTIIYIGPFGSIQYDGPAVAQGRHYPQVEPEAFRRWADQDVTDELPKGEYARWPLTNAQAGDGGTKS